MRYGCVITPDQISDAIAAGFDYIELPARELHPEGDHELALRTVSQAIVRAHYPLKVEVFWGLLPADLPIVGPRVDPQRLRHYLHRVFMDMWALGGMLVILASGPSRRIPKGFSRQQAEEQFAGMLALLEEEANRNGLDLALEPLNHAETNLLNTLDESRRFLATHSVQRVRLLADFYHLLVEGEPFTAIEKCDALIAHVHVADTARLPPGQGSAGFAPFFQALRRIGYDERISIRCHWHDFAHEAAAALAFVKQQWEASASAP